MFFLAIDPGRSTGWAAYDERGTLLDLGKISPEDKFLDWLEEKTPRTVILETYRNRPGFTNSWSMGPTQQHIGAIKRILRKKHVKIIEQEPSVLVIGCKWAGIPHKKGIHLDDSMSAHAHGTYYLINSGIKKHRMDKT